MSCDYKILSPNELCRRGFSFARNIVYYKQDYILRVSTQNPFHRVWNGFSCFREKSRHPPRRKAAGSIRPANLRSLRSVSLGLIEEVNTMKGLKIMLIVLGLLLVGIAVVAGFVIYKST